MGEVTQQVKAHVFKRNEQNSIPGFHKSEGKSSTFTPWQTPKPLHAYRCVHVSSDHEKVSSFPTDTELSLNRQSYKSIKGRPSLIQVIKDVGEPLTYLE